MYKENTIKNNINEKNDDSDKQFNLRNAGRKTDEPDMIAKTMLFDSMLMSNFSKKEILIEMEMTSRTFDRYCNRLEHMRLYYELWNVYPLRLDRYNGFNKYAVMSGYLKEILKAENVENIPESWKKKANEWIKYYEKIASLENKDKYRLFNSRIFDDIVMGYVSAALSKLIEKNKSVDIKKATELIKTDVLKTVLTEMKNGMSPEMAETYYREQTDEANGNTDNYECVFDKGSERSVEDE